LNLSKLNDANKVKNDSNLTKNLRDTNRIQILTPESFMTRTVGLKLCSRLEAY
jgi:hypothetical protein